MNGSSPENQLIQTLERKLEEQAKAAGVMELGFAVQAELEKIEGREKTDVEAAIHEIVTKAIKALAQR